ncbi:hypothetical protein NW761_005817 [Fusarium oxysporum]|jgi:hypothetical protein|nr:hypothetical protein NW753_011845 [Fusarium oxysporum]KAJ4043756.1 hypothetical protein NW758_006836 [Fusarium oxysporum]KAJ4068029.1 hypothetical protein NW763_001577 [Fusarium oxysporum]KAJ4086427.1 hypothetical protein NW756_008248 [Fusarium oxysporum]KAJ4092921.1 hypothetical protein NW769_012547 [Fusarium oxysporum]
MTGPLVLRFNAQLSGTTTWTSIADHKGNDLHATLCDRDRLAAFALLSTIVISSARINICTFFVDLTELHLEPSRYSLIWARGAAGGQSESPVLAPISQCTGAKDQKMPG